MEQAKLTFKERWENRKMLKRAKKQAKKELQKKGYNPSSASSMVKMAMRNIVKKPVETAQ
jgi:hypothetical protein